ncbi:unnamed protein product, partial [Staurois parvus]
MYWKELCPFIDVIGRNCTTLLMSLGGIVSLHWCQCGGRNSAPSLVSVGGGIVPHR